VGAGEDSGDSGGRMAAWCGAPDPCRTSHLVEKVGLRSSFSSAWASKCRGIVACGRVPQELLAMKRLGQHGGLGFQRRP